MALTFHVVGDAYVDFFSFLDGEWPENGGDSRLQQPVKNYAGGSSTNTATHLKALMKNFVEKSFKGNHENGDLQHNEQNPTTSTTPRVVLHTVLNPNDHYGQMILEHARNHDFPLINCRQESDTSWTGHCIAIVCAGERSFMTHQGCVENFSADHLQLDRIIETDGPLHMHIAGFFNVTGFWHGKLAKQLRKIRDERKARFPSASTTMSLVTQHDASKKWDGGLDEVVPLLDFLIMNELEANRILRRGKGESAGTDDSVHRVDDWIEFFSSLNPSACIVVTRGAHGAVAFRNGTMLATLNPAIAVTVIDPTGAGDSFTAGFLHGIWEWRRENGSIVQNEWPADAVKHGLLWGCAVGTAAVTIRGASNPSKPEDILSLLEQQRTINSS